MKEPRNPYKILGLEEDASKEDVKKAYRKLAAQYHPDRNRGDKESEEKFKEVSAAYQYLTNGKQREMFEEWAEAHGAENPLEFAFEMFMQAFDKLRPGVKAIQERGKDVFDNVFDVAKNRLDSDAAKKLTHYLRSDSIEKGSQRLLGLLDSKLGTDLSGKNVHKKLGGAFNKLGGLLSGPTEQPDDAETPETPDVSASQEQVKEQEEAPRKKAPRRRKPGGGNTPKP